MDTYLGVIPLLFDLISVKAGAKKAHTFGGFPYGSQDDNLGPALRPYLYLYPVLASARGFSCYL